MSQEGQKIRLQGVTEIKPQGITVRPPLSHKQKSKEGCIISTEMVKALKNALMGASSTNNGRQKELSKKTVCSKTQRHSNSSVTSDSCQSRRGVASPNKRAQKKTILKSTDIGEKNVTNYETKMEVITQMNLEGARSKLPQDLTGTRGHSEVEKNWVAPMLTRETPPTRRGQRETSKRKSLIAVPVSSPERSNAANTRISMKSGSAVKSLVVNRSETRKQLATVSLDRFILNRSSRLSTRRVEKIVPDLTFSDFMWKLQSYSNLGFRDARYERRAAKSPDLETIPEER